MVMAVVMAVVVSAVVAVVVVAVVVAVAVTVAVVELVVHRGRGQSTTNCDARQECARADSCVYWCLQRRVACRGEA
eukprot:6176840-Pleurochrysis_carterae.AAC.1